jgi:hypothetical protein
MSARNKDYWREWRLRTNQCKQKWAHPNILTAMKHAKDLSAKESCPFMFYECEQCGGIHVGRMGTREAWVMYGAYSQNIRTLQGFSDVQRSAK